MAHGGAASQAGGDVDEEAGISSIERILLEKDDNDAQSDLMAQLQEQALLYAKTGNMQGLEEVLDQDCFVDCTDDHGNTLLMLAAQQGTKKMVKMILRRGANLHAQNDSGNTILHYCHEYGHQDLADYFMSKGADDSVLNIEGLTCYEGLSRQGLDSK